jgi:predicted phage terminase large subunit-like protein
MKTLKTSNLSVAQYQDVLTSDFYAFIQKSFAHLNPRTPFLPNWHIAVIAAKLEACRRGKIKRLIICVPPRHLKTLCGSIALPAWILGHDPSAQILCLSYAQDLSDKLARDFRSVMFSQWYRALFSTRPLTRNQALQEFETKQHGFRLATSVGGVLTGRGADLIFIDDPIKPDEALSQSRRGAANQWFDNTLFSRLNDKNKGCIILIMQRLHEDDLVGHVLKQEGWEVVSFPAIAEKEEEFDIETPYGIRHYRRRPGDLLHPERESRDTLETISRALGQYNFASQYQQAPAPLGGGMVKTAWFKSYAPNEIPEHFDQIVQSWDTANKVSELCDYSVCTTWGIKDGHLYLLNVLRKRLEYPDLKRAVREHHDLYHATVVLIEDRASGTQLIQELRKEGLRFVKPYVPEGDKIMRMNAQTATIENGFVHLPKEAPWLADYLREITTFPFASNDDQADSTSQALAWFNQAPARHPVYEYYDRENALELSRNGQSIEAIAVQMRSAPEQVRSWLLGFETHSAKPDNRIIYARCATCGAPIYYNDPYGQCGPMHYHIDSSGKRNCAM